MLINWVIAWVIAAAVGAAAPVEGESATQVPVADALSVDTGDSCLEHDRLAERVVVWLKRESIDARLTIEVRDDPEVSGVRFVIRSDGEFVSERPFQWTTNNCADRHYVFALSIAMALDATVLENVIPEPLEPPADLPSEPNPIPDPDPPPEDPPPEDPPPEDPLLEDPPPRKPIHTAVRIAGQGVFTIGTPMGLGGGGQLSLELGWLELVDLSGRLFVTTTGEQDFAGGRFSSTAIAGRLDTCVGPKLGRIRPRACGGILSGIVRGRGREFQLAGRARLPWVAFVLGANVRAKLTSRLALDLALEGLGTAVKPVFIVESDSGDTPRAFASFGVVLGIGLAVQLR